MSSNQLWKLNKYLVCKLHLLPKINDLLQKFEGYKYASAIDLSMGYYHIPLEEYSQSLCGTIMPWGLCQCKVVPMGISNAPDIFQSTMATLLGNLSYILEYIDNILITSNTTFTNCLQQVHTVLQQLERVGFKANLQKCSFAAKHIEYLGDKISPCGIHAQPKKVESILQCSHQQQRGNCDIS